MNWLFSVIQLVLFSELKTYNMTNVAWFTIKLDFMSLLVNQIHIVRPV